MPASAEDIYPIPGSGRAPGERNGYPVQYSHLENHMDRGAGPSMGSQRVGHDIETEAFTGAATEQPQTRILHYSKYLS